MTKRKWIIFSAAAVVLALGGLVAHSQLGPRNLDRESLRAYEGVYQWAPNSYVYVQAWAEMTGTNQLVAQEESGEVRALFPTATDRFFAGPGAGVSNEVQSRIEFSRDNAGKVISLNWSREGQPQRTARKVEIERRQDVQFNNGSIQLSGTLISPTTPGPHPVVILVHASGAEDREYLLPYAHYLVRHGMAVLGYDKRGVGKSTGDWNKASFADLAGDVVAAFNYLKTRSDVRPNQIGMLGWSQAGWVMPLAATREPGFAFLISISGAGVSGAQTTIDQARNEMTANGMRQPVIDSILEITELQYAYLRTNEGWDRYMAARERMIARMGANPPDTIPGTPDHPYLQFLRPLIAYEPGPTIRQLKVPVLALFGELDNNIMATKNSAAWKAALDSGGHTDYSLRVIPRANHAMLEARVGNNAEMKTLTRFVPFQQIVIEWLRTHIQGFATGLR